MKVDCLSLIKKTAYLALLIAVLVFATACSPAHMTVKQENFDIMTVKPSPGKSALVIARTTSFGGAVNFHTHIERKLIGVTKGKGCLVKNDIEPGPKHLIARTESLETGKINFQPDTVYYVQQTPRIGWVVARVNLTPVSPEHLVSEIGSDGCTLYEVDPSNPGDDLSDHEYQEAVTDYNREVKEGLHLDFENYKGYKK